MVVCQPDITLWRYNDEQVRLYHCPQGACNVMGSCGRDNKQKLQLNVTNAMRRKVQSPLHSHFLSQVFLSSLYMCSQVISFTLLYSINDSQIEMSSSNLSKHTHQMSVGSLKILTITFKLNMSKTEPISSLIPYTNIYSHLSSFLVSWGTIICSTIKSTDTQTPEHQSWFSGLHYLTLATCH